MSQLDFLPSYLARQSISSAEIVLPLQQAIECIDYLVTKRIHILGWEGLTQDQNGSVGHGSAPQGTASLENYTIDQAGAICRKTILQDAETWKRINLDTTEKLYFCITVAS